jgi:hypothetical protein
MRRVLHWRNNTGAMAREYKGKKWFMRFGAVGSADIFALNNAVLYGIECNRPGGKQSDAQKDFQQRLEEAGDGYVLAFSLDEITKLL